MYDGRSFRTLHVIYRYEYPLEAFVIREKSISETPHWPGGIRVQGYFNCWPAIVRSEWETFAADERVYRSFPPSPEAIERMLEVMRWVQWLTIEQRHLVWMRAKRYGWRDITIRFACDRTTAWRHWQRALQTVADQLNGVVVA